MGTRGEKAAKHKYTYSHRYAHTHKDKYTEKNTNKHEILEHSLM